MHLVQFSDSQDIPDDLELQEVNLEAGMAGSHQQKFMKDFFNDVNVIKQGIETIKKNIRLMEDKSAESLEEDSRATKEIEMLIVTTNEAAKDVRTYLRKIDTSTKELNGKAPHSELKIRKIMQTGLTKTFFELMQHYQAMQTKYKDQYRQRAAEQYRLVKPEATDEEIEDVIETGSSRILDDALLDTDKRKEAQKAITSLQKKAQEIRRLEHNIIQLQELFNDLALMVEVSGDMVDQIEYNATMALANTQVAVESLRKAELHKRRSRKRMCCLIVLLIVILLLLGGAGAILGIVFKK